MKQPRNIEEKQYWRSLEQLAGMPELKKTFERDFPEGTAGLNSGINRRNFLALMGASMALAGLAGCRRPVEKVIPYVTPPEEIIPGIPQYYATAMPFGAESFGVIVESREGRPIKIEGNKDHPSTMGSSSAFMQAEILGLYDPDRSRHITQNGDEKSWSDFVEAWQGRYSRFIGNRGEGLAIVAGSYASPTLARLERELRARLFQAQWVIYEPVSDENIYNGIEIASGSKYRPVYSFDRAKRVLSLDSDFLQTASNSIANMKGFTSQRRVSTEKDDMNRLYVVESGYSVTGSMADHRRQRKSSHIGIFTAALALELQRQGLRINGLSSVNFREASAISSPLIPAAARDLLQHRGECIVIAGRRQPAGVHALVYAINTALGNTGKTVEYRPFRDTALPERAKFADLVREMNSGRVDTLLILGCNPVYDAPADLEFKKNVKSVNHIIHFGQYSDETARIAEWHVPQAHFLESWGDTRSADGTLSIIQPLIKPLFGGKMTAEFFNLICTGQEKTGYETVRDTWRRILSSGDFEKQWRKILHDGLLPGSALPAVIPGVNAGSLNRFLNSNPFPARSVNSGNIEVVFHSSHSVHDGRFANNGWLQELPDPITKITWDNTAVISPNTAKELLLRNGDKVRLTYRGREMEMPVWIIPGQADYSVSLELGYGKTTGSVASGAGFNTYLLRTSEAPDFDTGLELKPTGVQYPVSCVQDHGSLEGRPHIIEADLEEYRKDPHLEEMREHSPPLKSLWKEHSYDEGYQWGMTIDLNVCTGCNACVIACQSENNIPVVGKERVAEGREMHWLRIDRYFAGTIGNADSPEILYQPMACQHCELAPCEQVCPVAATIHDREGLNVMVYNRCIGTRYCSNNCPVKVRRFNFFNYTKDTPESMKMGMNPDVTVRSRGVMEKCTYCLQRISRAKIAAKLEKREIKDGEILTACQQACPSEAIVFGNVNDPESSVSKVKNQNRNYIMLLNLNLKQRTSYLAKLRNQNPDLL